jgi:hypothetical protein
MANGLKVGDKVQIVKGAEAEEHKGEVFECTSMPWNLGCGTEVVMLDRVFSGGFRTSFLKKVK